AGEPLQRDLRSPVGPHRLCDVRLLLGDRLRVLGRLRRRARLAPPLTPLLNAPRTARPRAPRRAAARTTAPTTVLSSSGFRLAERRGTLMMLRGKVAVVTGAGRGIGPEIRLPMARPRPP